MKKGISLAVSLMLALAVAGGAFAQSITYGIWDANQRPALEKLITAFQADNPAIKVTLQVVPWGDYWTKLTAATAGGQAFDVFWMNGPNFPVYSSKGILRDLTGDFKKAGVDVAMYPKALVSLYAKDGKNYGLPKDFDTIGLYYNKDLFDKAKVAYPNDTWTWDDLKKAAKALTDPKAGVWGFAAITGDQAGWWNFVLANGGQLLSADQTKVMVAQGPGREALKYLYSFVQDGTSPDGSTMASIEPETQLFPGGKVAMITAGSWMAKTYSTAPFKIDVAPLPKAKIRATIIHGVANVVWNKGKNQEAAAKFAAFLSTKKAQQMVADSGSVIPAYQGLATQWVASIPSMHAQVLVDAAQYAVPYPSSVKGMEWNDQIAAVLADIWNGATPFDEGMTKLETAGNAALKRAQ